ncbi:tyrosine-type recombinase/integrase [Rosenbergiella nectarea]|uniref:tyrosine-type recombinase/integrase n=1 Tax=Rosenbergiella nectarea TaxID=988801 RepID=UPI0030C86A49
MPFPVCFHTGLLSSELCALRWGDIDFSHKIVHVQKASVVGVIKGTKTTSGNRKVDLDDQAITALNT